MNKKAEIRTFESGATRNADTDKYDYEGFLSPLVLERYAKYMHKHRKQANGELRASDNWQKGLPQRECLKSLWRHLMDLWKHTRGIAAAESKEDALCAVIFNASAMLHEELKWSTHASKTNFSQYPETVSESAHTAAAEEGRRKLYEYIDNCEKQYTLDYDIEDPA
jgi:hypothetical protein